MNARIICMFSDATGQWRLSVQTGSDFWALPMPAGAQRDFLAAGVPLRDDEAMRRAIEELPAATASGEPASTPCWSCGYPHPVDHCPRCGRRASVTPAASERAGREGK